MSVDYSTIIAQALRGLKITSTDSGISVEFDGSQIPAPAASAPAAPAAPIPATPAAPAAPVAPAAPAVAPPAGAGLDPASLAAIVGGVTALVSLLRRP